MDYHLAHGGISRFEKFRHYYSELLNKPVNEAEIKALGDEFSSLVLEEVLAAPFIPGALETLDELLNLRIPAFVVSGTPEEEVRQIVQMRQLSKYFVEVHGSPRKKVDIVEDIIVRRGAVPSRCLFLGDAMTDYEAAGKAGVAFIGIVHDINRSPFPLGTTIISSVNCNYTYDIVSEHKEK